jgi:hypothetical protein
MPKVSTPFPLVQTVLSANQPVRETIKAGGAYLKEKEKEKEREKEKDKLVDEIVSQVSTPIGLGPYVNAQHVSPTFSTGNSNQLLNPSNDSLASLDYTLSPPENPTHHKQPSMHAHFYVDETVKANKVTRSRSGSNTSENIASKSSSVNSLPKPTRNLGEGSLPTNGATSNTSPSLGKGEQNANIDPRLMLDDGKIHILFGVCGALSTVKIKAIIGKLLEIYTPAKVKIQLILTKSSENFISQENLNILENVKGVKVWRDSDEWTTWKTRLDPVLHIELRRWADILVVCPLTANTLSKVSLGLCDNLLTNVIRAWNTAYPILLAPAMVSYSYNAISTKRQIKSITEQMPWIEILKPVEKVFGSYGDIGMGGMMDWNEVVNKIVMKLGGYPEEDDNEDKNDEAIVDDEDDNDEDDNDDDNDDDDDDDDDDIENYAVPNEDQLDNYDDDVNPGRNSVLFEDTQARALQNKFHTRQYEQVNDFEQSLDTVSRRTTRNHHHVNNVDTSQNTIGTRLRSKPTEPSSSPRVLRGTTIKPSEPELVSLRLTRRSARFA